jgi:hypothetical protein
LAEVPGRGAGCGTSLPKLGLPIRLGQPSGKFLFVVKLFELQLVNALSCRRVAFSRL